MDKKGEGEYLRTKNTVKRKGKEDKKALKDKG